MVQIDLGSAIADLNQSIENCREFLEWYLDYLETAESSAKVTINAVHLVIESLPAVDDEEFIEKVTKSGFAVEE